MKKNIKKYDLVIVADYGHGIFTEKIRNLILEEGNKVFLNTQINSFNRGYHTVYKYKNINTLIINEGELRFELRDKYSSVVKLARALSKKINVENIIVTRGSVGSMLINRKKRTAIHCPAFSKNNTDTVGAGDTFFAICSLLLKSKIDSYLSMLIASIAASFLIDQQGNKIFFNKEILKKYLIHMFK